METRTAHYGLVQVGVATDTGQVRSENQDAYRLLPERGLFVVSDGMGGRNAGDTAARIVVEVLPLLLDRALKGVPVGDVEATSLAVRDAILDVSRDMNAQAAEQPGLQGMGATVVLVVIRGDVAHIAHLGDSRAYQWHDGELRRVTEDHSIVALLLSAGEITLAEAEHHPSRGALTRFVGMDHEVYPDVRALSLEPGDRLLLCTDGLTGMIGDDMIAAILADNADAPLACAALVGAANQRGGRDNITAVVIDWASQQFDADTVRREGGGDTCRRE